MERKVVVLGASGRTGRSLVDALDRRGIAVSAVTRDPGRSGLFPKSVEPCFGDLSQIDSLAAALRGASAIHYIPLSLDPNDHAYIRNILSACAINGISRLVYHSVLHPHTPDLVHHMRKAASEAQVRDSSLVWTIIQPAMYIQTALAFFDAAASELNPPFNPSRPFTPVHLHDLSEAAAIIHSSEGHVFATYELAGLETLDFEGMGERLSDSWADQSKLGRSRSTLWRPNSRRHAATITNKFANSE